MTLALALPHSIIVVPLILNGYSTPVVVSIPKCETKEGITTGFESKNSLFHWKYDLWVSYGYYKEMANNVRHNLRNIPVTWNLNYLWKVSDISYGALPGKYVKWQQ